jgi:hypothetical protein
MGTAYPQPVGTTLCNRLQYLDAVRTPIGHDRLHVRFALERSGSASSSTALPASSKEPFV